MQTLILKLILRSNEKYSRISDLKGDDLDEKGAFCQGWKNLQQLGAGFICLCFSNLLHPSQAIVEYFMIPALHTPLLVELPLSSVSI